MAKETQSEDTAKRFEAIGFDVETMWGDEGFIVRFPDADGLIAKCKLVGLRTSASTP